MAISYSGRQEIVDAFNRMIKEKITSTTVDQFPNFLYTSTIPDPDLLIRTAGENRISNFLLWQIAYTEIYVSKVYWPEFNDLELDKVKKKFGIKEEELEVREEEEEVKSVKKVKVNIQRYKGLGEMNPEQLWETTLNPQKRTLLKVQIEDEMLLDETFVRLMGEKVEPRRDYIQANAKKVINLDI